MASPPRFFPSASERDPLIVSNRATDDDMLSSTFAIWRRVTLVAAFIQVEKFDHSHWRLGRLMNILTQEHNVGNATVAAIAESCLMIVSRCYRELTLSAGEFPWGA